MVPPVSITRRSVEFQRFLIALSVRPGSSLAISAHRFSNRACASISSASSAAVHFSFFTFGSSWLCHRSRICFPDRPGRCTASADHDLTPNLATNCTTCSSSSVVHGHLVVLFSLLPSPPGLVRPLHLRITALAASTSSVHPSSSPLANICSMLDSFTSATRRATQAARTAGSTSLLDRCTTGTSISFATTSFPVYRHSSTAAKLAAVACSHAKSSLVSAFAPDFFEGDALLTNRPRKYSLTDASTSACALNCCDSIVIVTSHSCLSRKRSAIPPSKSPFCPAQSSSIWPSHGDELASGLESGSHSGSVALSLLKVSPGSVLSWRVRFAAFAGASTAVIVFGARQCESAQSCSTSTLWSSLL